MIIKSVDSICNGRKQFEKLSDTEKAVKMACYNFRHRFNENTKIILFGFYNTQKEYVK